MSRRTTALFAGIVGLTALLIAVACSDSPGGGDKRDPTSIVLVVVDTLRADHLGVYGYERPTSPRIDAWSRGARVFERAYATSPWTLPSFGTILTGRLPTAHAAGIKAEGLADDVTVATERNFVTLADGVPTVAEILRSAGYATGAFVTNPFLDPRFGLDRGFAEYDYDQAGMNDMRRAGPVVDASLAWIESHADRPFFVLVHMFDPHLDYDAPPPYRGRFTHAEGLELPVSGLRQIRNRIPDISAVEQAFITGAYDEEIAYVDEQFGRLVDGLEARGLLRDSLLILTADHGEELFDHGGFEHGHSMYDEVLRVPLIVAGPGVRAGRETTPVSLTDLASTILETAGEAVPDGVTGQPLMVDGDAPAQPLIAERVLYGPESKAIIVWPYKAVVDVDDGGARLFDLAADPGEQRDVSAQHTDMLRELLGMLSAELSEARRWDPETRDAELDEAALDRLRALGYLSGGHEEIDARSDDRSGEGRSGASDAAATVDRPSIRLVVDAAAFDAPPPPASAPFDVISADMDDDDDPDLFINWHHVAASEIFENEHGVFELINAEGRDRSGVFENAGIASLFADAGELLPETRRAGHPGVFVWHDRDRNNGDWHFLVVPDGAPVSLTLLANQPLSLEAVDGVTRRADEFEVELRIDSESHFRAHVDLVATELHIESSLPIFAGAELRAVGRTAGLWKDDPHGIAWVDARGSPEPDLFITRGALAGMLLPPHDPKVDRFFERRPSAGDAELMYEDVRDLVPPGYGRGRRVEWVDIDGDSINELYIGNTQTPNVLLAGGRPGGYRDVAADAGLDFTAGDTFVWFDLDGNDLDDLVFIDEEGFRIAYNRGDRTFDVRPGDDIGLRLPAGPGASFEGLFTTMSLNVLDYDSDGRLDLWLTGHGDDRRIVLYRRDAARFVDVTADAGLAALPPATSVVFGDLDNDGYQDALVFGSEPTLLHNAGGRRFEASPLGDDLGLQATARGVVVDVDGDLRLDVVVADRARLLLRNVSAGGSALRVRPRAAGNDPVGTVVSAVYADGMIQSQRLGSALSGQYSQGIAPLHFGIAPGNAIERLVVTWPDGSSETRNVGDRVDFIELQR